MTVTALLYNSDGQFGLVKLFTSLKQAIKGLTRTQASFTIWQSEWLDLATVSKFFDQREKSPHLSW